MIKQTNGLPNKIAQDLIQRIVAEEFPPSSVLPSERELQEHYGVSRTVVREAIKLLSARGIISTSAGQSALVGANMTRPAIDALLLAFHRAHACKEDLLSTRMLLEPPIAALAAQHATPQQVRRMKSLVAALAAIQLDGDAATIRQQEDAWGLLDAQFHVLLADAAQNPVLTILIDVLVGMLWEQDISHRTHLSGAWLVKAAEQHRLIAEAVEQHDANQAWQHMRDHLETTRQSLEEVPGGLFGLISIT